ncbi:hypothetical protein BXP70_14150 [Hymenobacter crusticola]|uniref:Carboxypeptidase-like regulatory domain-containing protein n=2 Tax=Hymenobacter crusticola TaxID=1770526 RepID=A0A243WCZ2_9BACT|nr:hypothetical protein BXP70_14150 [Hymenobacter crusticola]
MTPATHGRYCAACEKVVVDFSCMSEAELLDFFATRPSERVCGRFRPDQLEQPRPAPPTAAPSWARWLATAAVALSSCEMPPPLVGQLDAQQATAATEFFTVRGHVTDRVTRVPLANAYITCLQDTTHTVRTGLDGSFELLLPVQLIGSKLLVRVDNGFLYSAHVSIATPKLNISLQPLEPVVGQVQHDNLVMGDTVLLPEAVVSVIKFTPPRTPSAGLKSINTK